MKIQRLGTVPSTYQCSQMFAFLPFSYKNTGAALHTQTYTHSHSFRPYVPSSAQYHVTLVITVRAQCSESQVPKHRHSFNFYPTSYWVWSTWEPWGSHQPPRRLFLLERIMTTFWTIHRISNKQTSHWGPSKQHLIILLKSVFCQVHSDFIFWQKHLYAKQDSRHVQARDPIYSAGPQLSSTRWIMPPALETYFPTPTSLIPWAPELVPR